MQKVTQKTKSQAYVDMSADAKNVADISLTKKFVGPTVTSANSASFIIIIIIIE